MMAYQYSNVEYTEMVRMLARCDDNVSEARRQYAMRFPNVRTPNRETIIAATQRLRDHGQFRNPIRDSGRPPRHTVREEEGTGRNSSRIASQRVKNINNRKHSKVHKNNNGTASPDANEGGATYETMTADNKKNHLIQICGVVSEHTKKFCTRSTRCPLHTEEQRRALRNSVLEPSSPESQIMDIKAEPQHTEVQRRALRNSVLENLEPSMPESQTMDIKTEEAGSPPDSSPSSFCSSSSRKLDRHWTPPQIKIKNERSISPNTWD